MNADVCLSCRYRIDSAVEYRPVCRVIRLVLAAVAAVVATVVVAGVSMVFAACTVADDERWDTAEVDR